MKKYGISLTKIYNGYIEVMADSEEDALKKAEESLDTYDDWTYGETTADFVEEI